MLGENSFVYSNKVLPFSIKSINPIQKYSYIVFLILIMAQYATSITISKTFHINSLMRNDSDTFSECLVKMKAFN